MSSEFIQTKIRPIKKLFIINENDFSAFIHIFNEISDEIDSIQNIIFINDTNIWSDVNLEFIRRHDPDIILNISDADNKKLSNHFNIMSVDPNNDSYKIGRFGTTLSTFTNKPLLYKKFHDSLSNNVVVAKRIENTPSSLLNAINFGVVEDKKELHIDLTIFKDLNIRHLKDNEDIKDLIFDNEKKFIYLTNELGAGSGGGTSIWEINYNKENIFEKGKFIFVSEPNNIKAITYFWNTRATYSFAKLAWLPENLLDDFIDIIDDTTTFVSFSTEIDTKIKKLFPKATIICPERLFFKGAWDRWKCFEYNQIINVDNNSLIIQHPTDKSFNDIGFGGAFILEARNLKEFHYPIRECIGVLYNHKHHDTTMFPERFTRVSRKGISKYMLQIDPFSATDHATSLTLPTFNEVVVQLLKHHEYKIQRTVKSSIIEQLINLIGGINESNILCEKDIFHLIISLTPRKRTDKAIETLLGKDISGLDKDQIVSLLGKVKETGAVSFPKITMTIEQLLGKASIKTEEKEYFLNTIQNLYNKKIFLRGKNFKCSHCSSDIWLPLEELGRDNFCYECSNKIDIPVHIDSKTESDSYRLNELVVRAVDQGQLSTLLLLNYFSKQNIRLYNFITNLEVFHNDKLLTDIDVLIRYGRKFGIGECKSHSGFNLKQVDELIDLAIKSKFDFILFSCLLSKDNDEITKLVTHLKNKQIDFPVFIFTSNELFSKTPKNFHKYFELLHTDNFAKGVILV